MKKSDVLKQERAGKLQTLNNLVELRKTEKRDFTSNEESNFDTLEAEIRNFDVKIEREIKIEANEARKAIDAGLSAQIESNTNEPQKRFSLLKALNTLSRGKELTGVEGDVNAEAIAEMRSQGMEVGEGLRIALPTRFSRAQTVDGDSGAKGAAMVPSTPQLVQPLQPVLPLEQLGVSVLSGLVGDVPLPTTGTFTFSYVGETADVSASDVGVAGPTLKPKRCSGVVEISKKLLLQTSFAIEAHIINLMNIAYGNAITSAAINGSGSDAPTGLYSSITTNINTTAGVPSFATIVDLESLIEDQNATNIARGYFSGTKLRGKIKTTAVDAGSGIFLSDGREMNGYKYMASTLAPTLDSGASHPLIFGDWSQLTVGYWGNLSIMVDPYSSAASGKVRLIVDGYSDVAVTNEKAFAINKVMTLS